MILRANTPAATVTLGDIPIDAYQLPNGDYVLGRNKLAKAIDKQPISVSRFMTGKSPDALPYKGLEVVTISVNGGTAHALPLDFASDYWFYWAMKGNVKAKALTKACIAEALERRVDAAFGVKRDEEERDQRFVIRRDGILSRNFYTDCIEAYVRRHANELSDTYKKFIYVNVSNMLNKAMFGMTSKEIKERYQIPKEASIRDSFPASTLKEIDTIEKSVANLINNKDIEPQEALKSYIDFVGIKPGMYAM